MFYRISLFNDSDPGHTTIYNVWPGADTPKGDDQDQDKAETEFARLSKTAEYLNLHKDREYLLPLVLTEFAEEEAQHHEGEELDRTAYALILDDLEEFEIDDLDDNGRGPREAHHGPRSWVVFEDSEAAGEAAAEHYRDMAKNDPKEFATLVGNERLVQWAMDQQDSFGISSLESFCEAVARVPEEHWARHDGQEREVSGYSEEAEDLFGFAPGVAYRQ